ncbi:hypothetical protein OK349_17680 [Sphingomonas sp. BT-65]|uniref:hypothetical protein n=1 Tax=Sphingomonas sp. BT-65 TaxID=2989821 RepID=UPI00223595E4|nr:hypothetical protein [Sphingomonas sp. BT-65]MCW4463541.1 hypothetical protein [Sphingomonas sp. BT-65]
MIMIPIGQLLLLASMAMPQATTATQAQIDEDVRCMLVASWFADDFANDPETKKSKVFSDIARQMKDSVPYFMGVMTSRYSDDTQLKRRVQAATESIARTDQKGLAATALRCNNRFEQAMRRTGEILKGI